MAWLLSVYIAFTVFGGAVILMDTLGLLGSHHDGDSDSSHHDFADHTHDGDDSHNDFSDSHHHDAPNTDEDSAHTMLTPAHVQKIHPILRIFSLLRSLVYFSLGFGPVGIMATYHTSTPLLSLFWSVPSGIFIMALVKTVRRFLRRELNSLTQDEDLLMNKAEVMVSIGLNQMGKVRVFTEGANQERYARAKNPSETFPVGAQVRVVEVSEECLFVETL